MSVELKVIYTPQQIRQLPNQDLKGSICVVIDVLRATSTMVTGLANGAKAFYPVAELEDAFAAQKSLGDALLAGERFGLKPEGFHFGNSPREFTGPDIKEKTIIHTTTNGTRAILACKGADEVWIGSFLNFSAVVERLKNADRGVLICAGTFEDFALEDSLLAGAIANEASPDHPVASIHRANAASLHERLRVSRNGRKLFELGLEKDVEWCAQQDLFPILPKWSAQSGLISAHST
jgi:2-phosphosulfolactate phosphatase